MKEKTLVFRYLRKLEYLNDGVIKDEDAKSKLIEDELSRGYVPLNVRFENYDIGFQKIRACYCLSAYAGKKSAREFGYLERDMSNSYQIK